MSWATTNPLLPRRRVRPIGRRRRAADQLDRASEGSFGR